MTSPAPECLTSSDGAAVLILTKWAEKSSNSHNILTSRGKKHSSQATATQTRPGTVSKHWPAWVYVYSQIFRLQQKKKAADDCSAYGPSPLQQALEKLLIFKLSKLLSRTVTITTSVVCGGMMLMGILLMSMVMMNTEIIKIRDRCHQNCYCYRCYCRWDHDEMVLLTTIHDIRGILQWNCLCESASSSSLPSSLSSSSSPLSSLLLSSLSLLSLLSLWWSSSSSPLLSLSSCPSLPTD